MSLPPNPYKRSPIKKREDLAGRAREQKAIRYYLSLTAAGQSPHLALIGQRGVGKTSLLNAAESIAKDLKLLPVRLDMNEQKANSQWIFWRDLYQTLALAMAKAGCWGGVQGKIYADLLRMIHANQGGNLDSAVMQIPFVFSCHQGNIDSFECPDALVVNDFESCLTELKSNGFAGITLLIDEADCLGQNVPLLQMFRNIFQTVEHCSLILAGTEAVFPALSEVFSPIPRQFHRIDIKPFARWSDTRELVTRPIPENIRDIAPTANVVRELHELCGGAPDEVQLYCHHMYRIVEDGSSKRMSLAPQVFREVLREYRSNSPANIDSVLAAIERLPDKLLFESKWVGRRKLTLEENIRISILAKELKRKQTLSKEEKSQIVAEQTDGYQTLFNAGIIEISNVVRLAGAPLTAGFWKSFVEVERGKRWTWDDDSYSEDVLYFIALGMGEECGALGEMNISSGQDAIAALKMIRAGDIPRDFDEGMGEMISTCLFARDEKSTHVADVALQIVSPAGKHTFHCRFLEKSGSELMAEKFQHWIESNRAILKGNEISVALSSFNRWMLPTDIELHRLGRITGYQIPQVFGPSEGERAISLFAQGDMQGCMDTFSRMLKDKEAAYVRNNLGFCQLIANDIKGGLDNFSKALVSEYMPLYEMNKGIAEHLSEKYEDAKQSLRHALKKLSEMDAEHNEADYVLVLEFGAKLVKPTAGLKLDAAILINLWRMGDLSREQLEAQLALLSKDKVKAWLANFPAT